MVNEVRIKLTKNLAFQPFSPLKFHDNFVSIRSQKPCRDECACQNWRSKKARLRAARLCSLGLEEGIGGQYALEELHQRGWNPGSLGPSFCVLMAACMLCMMGELETHWSCLHEVHSLVRKPDSELVIFKACVYACVRVGGD